MHHHGGRRRVDFLWTPGRPRGAAKGRQECIRANQRRLAASTLLAVWPLLAASPLRVEAVARSSAGIAFAYRFGSGPRARSLLRWVPQWHQSFALIIHTYGDVPLCSLACPTVCRAMRSRGGVMVERRGFDPS
jgi:hypothetical protein